MYLSSRTQRTSESEGLEHVWWYGDPSSRSSGYLLHSITWVREHTRRSGAPLCIKAVLGGLLLLCVSTNASNIYLCAVWVGK